MPALAPTRPRPLAARPGIAAEEAALTAADGTRLALTRISTGPRPRPAVLLLHGHTTSADMFLLPETRNLVDVLVDRGYEPWLLDWRGSCRLPYNETGAHYTFDDVALYDIPAAVKLIRQQIGEQPLFVVAHCMGALALSMSLSAGLVPGLAGVVAQGVFLTPKLVSRTRLRMTLGGELLRSRVDHIPVDFRKVGLRSRYALLFALASIGATCPDPTCQFLQNSAWGVGASLYVHANLHPRTHDRLPELFGVAPLWILPHLRRIEFARTVVRWNSGDDRYSALPENALDHADRIDCPLLLISGSENQLWGDSNELCWQILKDRQPQLDVRYIEVPGYGHLDTFIGRSSALDVFGHILQFIDGVLT
jgi:alpha-beta hydrolase superfamily lysophospholipase